MAISVNLNKAIPASFNLAFPILPTEVTLDGTKELVLNIFGTILPGLTLENVEGPWQGGRIQLQIGKITFDPWTVNFVVDSELKNWQTLNRWMFYINNNKDRFGVFPNEMAVDASLSIVDNFGGSVLSVTFKNVWIQQLGELTFSMRDGEANLESSATFQYDRYEIA